MLKISIIIPVKNGAQTLGRCLQSVRAQMLGASADIIVLDSMSTDASRQIAAMHGARIIEVQAGTFDHGLTRNLGVQYASNELLFFTVQDAWLAEDGLLETMASHFNDPEVMAVVGHQAVPHEKDKNPVLWFKRFSVPTVQVRKYDNPATFLELPVRKQMHLASLDNVVAMYRKHALQEQPFIQTAFAEDKVWAFQALARGWKIIYDPSLVVYHYHHRDFDYSFNVTFSLNYHLYYFFKSVPDYPSIVIPFVKAIRTLIKNKHLSNGERLSWTAHTFAGMFGQYLSNFYFIYLARCRNDRAIKKAYLRFCKKIPQGFQKAV